MTPFYKPLFQLFSENVKKIIRQEFLPSLWLLTTNRKHKGTDFCRLKGALKAFDVQGMIIPITISMIPFRHLLELGKPTEVIHLALLYFSLSLNGPVSMASYYTTHKFRYSGVLLQILCLYKFRQVCLSWPQST